MDTTPPPPPHQPLFTYLDFYVYLLYICNLFVVEMDRFHISISVSALSSTFFISDGGNIFKIHNNIGNARHGTSYLFYARNKDRFMDNTKQGTITLKSFYTIKKCLKVVTNEKWKGSGSWLVFEDGFGLWRSMSVYFLMLPSSFLGSISVSFL